MKTENVKGFVDYLGEDAQKRMIIQEVIKQVFEKYNYEYVETPIIEYEEFVKGENQNDEAISDIFRLQDKGKRKLALRYEFTFQLKRIAKNKKLPFKRFQIGPVFRDEPITGNRLRQFSQCDIDVIGSSIKEEAEILAITKEIFNALKIKSVIYVNNRKILEAIARDIIGITNDKQVVRAITLLDKKDKKSRKELIEEFEKEFPGNRDKMTLLLNTYFNLTEDKEKSKKKSKKEFLEEFNDSLKKLKKYYIGVVCINRKQKYENTLFAKAEKEIDELKNYCKIYGVDIKFDPFLARGLSYYNGNVFEIKSDIKETICAGGSYMINGNQSTGISLGLDRLQLVTKMIIGIEKYLIVSLNQDKKAIQIAKQLRAKGKNTSVYFGKPSKALEYANSYGIKKVIFIGKEEIKKKLIKIKDMKTGREQLFEIKKVV